MTLLFSRYEFDSISNSPGDVGRSGGRRGRRRHPARLARVDDDVVLLLEAAVRPRAPRLVALLAHLAAPLALRLPVAAVVPALAAAHLRADGDLLGQATVATRIGTRNRRGTQGQMVIGCLIPLPLQSAIAGTRYFFWIRTGNGIILSTV